MAGPINSADESCAAIRWSAPDAVWRNAVQSSRRTSIGISIRVPILIALAEWSLHHWLAPILPSNFPWLRVNGAIMGMTAIYAIMAMLGALTAHRKPIYQLTDDGFLLPSREDPRLGWKLIASFTVETHAQLPDYNVLVLHLFAGARSKLLLPGGQIEAEILAGVSSRLPQALPPPRYAALRPLDWGLGFAITTIFVCTGGPYLASHMHPNRGSLILSYFLLGGLLAGPGTWVAIALHRRRANWAIVSLAGLLNIHGTVAAFTFAMVLRTVNAVR